MPVMSNVASVIDRHVRTVTCQSFQGVVVQSNGEATDNTYITSTKQMAVLSMSARELQTLPDGMYDKFDRKAYTKDTDDILLNESIIETDFGKFKVMSQDNRYFEGGYVVYYCKRLLV